VPVVTVCALFEYTGLSPYYTPDGVEWALARRIYDVKMYADW